MHNQQEGKLKQIIKKGSVSDIPAYQSLLDMLCKKFSQVFLAQKLPATTKRDGKVGCKCKCGRRLRRDEMIQVLPDKPNYLWAPECAAMRAAKKQRSAERGKMAPAGK